MAKKIAIFILALVLLCSTTTPAFACNEQQSNLYVTKILFGENYLRYQNNVETEKILDALYICSMQSNNLGQEKLNQLKKEKVSNIPSLGKVNISGNDILKYSHNCWNTNSKDKIQVARKDVLRRTVVDVFDFGWVNEKFKSKSGQIDSFVALMYYSHVLADYIANDPTETEISVNGYDIPAYNGDPAIELKGNVPSFSKEQIDSNVPVNNFSQLDKAGRTGTALMTIGPETLAPPNSRPEIGYLKPSGWHQGRYDGILNTSPPYLYNRCHLIAHQLCEVNSIENLITGTRYLNEAMEPYENKVAKYVKETGNHVLYKATPVYVAENAMASGVQLEAYSIEDNGELSFNVYLYNVQPGVSINYANGVNEQVDNVIMQDTVIPFAILNAEEANPDLMFEIKHYLEILFEGQKETSTYKEMMNKLQEISNEIRKDYSVVSGSNYAKFKEIQYKYMEQLTTYVPKLLANESFFKSAFG